MMVKEVEILRETAIRMKSLGIGWGKEFFTVGEVL